LKISDKVIFIGQSCEMIKYYASCDIFVLPTSYEPFGLVITEAMASGLPVIVSQLAGAAELIHNMENGLLLTDYRNPNEIAFLILQLMDSNKRRKLGLMARKRVEEFTWEEMSRKVSDLYRDVLV